MHSTTKPGGTGAGGQPCADLPDQEITIKGDEDGGTSTPGDGCTVESDNATCTFTTTCKTTSSGYTTTSESTFTSKGDMKGTSHSKTVKDDDQSVMMDCSYDFTWTKK
jgi:hypothetical protein